MIPTVDFCGLEVTRLIIGANPFAGFSHQTPERDEEMLSFYTPERIKETWILAERAGINTCITNNETAHVLQALRGYLHEGGSLNWIAQVNMRDEKGMKKAAADVVEIGCKAMYLHGAQTDGAYQRKDEEFIRRWSEIVRSFGIPVGVAAHAPEAHLWVNSMDVVDFHAVCFFNCGSLHDGAGEKFRLADIAPAIECIQRIDKPCIGYKIMGAGRIDPKMAFEYAIDGIKPTDVVNVGMHRGDMDGMVEENVAIICKLLCC